MTTTDMSPCIAPCHVTWKPCTAVATPASLSVKSTFSMRSSQVHCVIHVFLHQNYSSTQAAVAVTI